jgi:hypothetical protein
MIKEEGEEKINWGLGIGDWGLGIGPNPQSPIPNPQSPISIIKLFYKKSISLILLNFKIFNFLKIFYIKE